jgi:hypothetical protein
MKTGFYLLLFSFFFFGSVLIVSQPLPPENLIAVQGSSLHYPAFVKLNWSSPSNMVRFNLYRKDGAIADTGSFVRRAAGLRNLYFNDMLVVPGNVYSYYVTAVNPQGESLQSNVVEITITINTGLGNITGVIVNDVTQEPILNASAAFMKTTGYGPCITVRSDSNGIFNANVPAGTYYFKTFARGYYPEFYDNVPFVQDATPVVVIDGSTLNFNIGLAPFVPPAIYTLSGSVKDSLDNPLAAVIRVYGIQRNTSQLHVMSARTDSLGNFIINVRENDTVVVYAATINHNYIPEFWDNKFTFADADRIPVTGNITGINFVMQHKPVFPNGINGIVTNPDNNPVESFVSAIRIESPLSQLRRYTVSTDEFGIYSFTNLIPGKYILRVDPKSGYRPTFFKYDGSQTLYCWQADSVMIDETSIVNGINFNVIPLPARGEGIVSGKVLSITGEAVNAAYVYAVNPNDEVAGYAITDASGDYIIDGLTGGEYQLISDKLNYFTKDNYNVTVDYSRNIFQSVNLIMSIDSPTEVGDNQPEVVSTYQLYQNYPNPFNPSTSIKFSLPEKDNVKITIYNLLGVEIAQLLNEVKSAGTHTITFDASSLASGIYFYKLETGRYSQTRKLTLIK